MATKTQNKQSVKVPTILQRIGEGLSKLDAAMADLASARSAVGFVRVSVGHLFVEYLAELASKGTTGEAAQEKILALVGDRTDENGKPYSWSTVEAWITAANTESSLPEDLRGVFNSDGLRTIARVGKKAGKDESPADVMAAFAGPLAKAGKVSVRNVRDAFTNAYPPATRAEASPADRAGKLQKDEGLADVAKTLRKQLAKANLSMNVILPFVYFGMTLGQAEKDPDAVTIAAKFLLDPKRDQA